MDTAGAVVKTGELQNFLSEFSKNKELADTASTMMGALIDAMGEDAWKDPESSAFLTTFKSFNKTAKDLLDEMNTIEKFGVARCRDYGDAVETALSMMPKF